MKVNSKSDSEIQTRKSIKMAIYIKSLKDKY